MLKGKYCDKDKRVYIVDTTLRDGEQTAKVVFANKEKTQIAEMLDGLGVDQIEVGTPVMGGDEREAIKAIVNQGLKASIMGWNRAVINDIQASIDCGVDSIAISISSSDIHIKNKLKSTREEVLYKMAKATEFAKEKGMYVSVNAEDASRTDLDFLITFVRTAVEAGADRFRYCDTIGLMDSISTFNTIKKILDKVKIDIEMHTHNDFGMATANALAGVAAGASYVGVTVNGLGERAGNAALEEVVMGLKYVLGRKVYQDPAMMRQLCLYVARASGRVLYPWKAVVGTNMFAHESGIHADGALKDPRTYEAFDPGEVGLTREIVIGKHSGTAAVIRKLKDKGLAIDNKIAVQLLPKVRSTAVSLKRSLSDIELVSIYEEHMADKGLPVKRT
ncbi:MAG: homocitrate synthase [Halanaerobiales bacterium]|nr:homocitrate synthase [Halanaerobiales bacterium]